MKRTEMNRVIVKRMLVALLMSAASLSWAADAPKKPEPTLEQRIA